MKRLLLGTVLALAVTSASAAHWTVDRSKSTLGFTVSWSGEPFSGSFKTWTADIDFDPADLAHSKASVTIDVTSEISSESEMDDGLKGAQGFQVVQFPKAQFATDNITHKSGNDYVTNGHLTLRGINKPVVLPFKLTINGNTAHMQGTAQVVRTDFGVGQGQWASGDPVAQQVKVTVDLTATRIP